MSLQDRIDALQKEHLAADEAVKANDIPGACPTMVRGLKLQRLHLKEELARLGAGTITKDRHKGCDTSVRDVQTGDELEPRHETQLHLTPIDGGAESEIEVLASVADATLPAKEIAAHAA
tara:strand:+ start:561 stop:920 length:360 start_codon:yes stop_codon:yes gene_type:complete